MTIKPLFTNILIKPKTAEKETSNGILLPDNAQTEKTQEGEVIDVGAGQDVITDKVTDLNNVPVITIPPKVKVGETVIYRTWGATEVKINNEKYVLVDQKDVLGVVHES